MKEVNQLFDAIHMPVTLENRILTAVPAPRRRFRPSLTAAAVLAVVLLVGCSPQVREMVKTTFPDLGLTIYEQEATEEGAARGSIIHVNTEIPTFAHVEEGRLIFTGNGEELDITDQITEETPFFLYTYQDAQGYEITLVVGYDSTIENFGTYTFLKKDGEYFTDAGRNIFSNLEEGQVYPWVQAVWNRLEIPWSMPGIVIDG